jgi:hypothetical protein
MELEKMKQKLEKLEKEYDGDFADEESMPNDLLNKAERIMVYQRRIISKLEKENNDLEERVKNTGKSLEETIEQHLEVRNKNLELIAQNRELIGMVRKIDNSIANGISCMEKADLVNEIESILEKAEKVQK